jgi:plasmid stabilization system protein ParE
MPRPRSVRITANFERNLTEIRAFLEDAGSEPAFGKLVARLSGELIPTLQAFPGIGADFLGRAPLSVDGMAMFEAVVKAVGPGAELRQWIDGDYVVLYLVKGQSVYLLSIRHHRQLSFDLPGHWP